MKKSVLKPGMIVRNKISGNWGEVRGEGKKLLSSHSNYVCVRRRTGGARKKRFIYPIWSLVNVEIVL
jgi:hypothetical protein